MVPRHQSYNSQDTCTINSSNGMYIRAVNDLKIAGATGGAGVVTVESKDTNISGTGGIVLRSLSNASLTANNVYIGRNTSTELNENTVSDPGPGVIIVDAGTKGSVSVKSKATLIQGTECIIGSLDGSSNSAVMVNQSQISLMASVVVAPAHLAIRNLGDTQQISIPALTGTETVSLTTANDPAISVTGSAAIGGSLKCNESGVFNKGLAASSVASKEGGMLGSIENAAAVFKPAELDAIEVIKQCGVYNADLVYATRSSVYQDYYITYNSFYFPSEYAILPTIRIPGMLWQTNIVEANGSGVWKEDYIKTPDGEDTACYPGIAVWNGANVSARGYSVQGKLNTGYIINAEGR